MTPDREPKANEDQLAQLLREMDEQLDSQEPDDCRSSDSAVGLAPAQLAELRRAEYAVEFLQRARRNLAVLDELSLELLDAESIDLNHDSTVIDRTEGSHTRVARRLPRAIGRFEILDVLGQGGFARVFLARDPDLDRLVALKMPLPQAISNPAARKRFQREARAAAVLSHPAIVPIFESGSVGPVLYIAFGFCAGPTLGQWFAKEGGQIPLQTAASIVAKLAEATEHAHQRGIVHRDLKLGNVLLESLARSTAGTDRPAGAISRRALAQAPSQANASGPRTNARRLMMDQRLAADIPGDGAYAERDDLLRQQSHPKSNQRADTTEIANQIRIADFGLARLDSSGEESLTIEGGVVGTPAYMSPEQARGDDDVGPSSDIFSLGTILYQLMTGQLPFRESTHLATLRAIEERSPTPPSRIRRDISKDLEAICLKCLRKLPTERYANAYELSADLERWLEGLPVHARPASAVEKMVAWSRRNPKLAFVTAIACLSFSAGLAGTTWQWHKARLESNRAELAAAEEQQARVRAERVAEFLGSTYRSPDPTADGRDLRVADMLARAEQEVEAEFADDAETRWLLQHRIGESYTGLGLAEQALRLLTKVHDEQTAANVAPSRANIDLLHELVVAHSNLGDFERASALCHDAHGLALEHLGPADELTYRILAERGRCAQNLGQVDVAIEAFEGAIAGLQQAGALRTEVLSLHRNLACAMRVARRAQEAIDLMEPVVSELETLAGADAPMTLDAKTELAVCLSTLQEVERAAALQREVLQAHEQVMGPDHLVTLRTMSNLGGTLIRAGETEAAVEVLTVCVERSVQKVGDDSVFAAVPMAQLARAYVQAGDHDLALKFYHRTLPIYQNSLGLQHARTKTVAMRLGELLGALERWKEAAEFFERLAIDYAAVDAEDSYDSIYMRALAGRYRILDGTVEKGLEQTQPLFAVLSELPAPNQGQRDYLRLFHGVVISALLSQNAFDEAIPLAERYVDIAATPVDQFLSRVLAAASHAGATSGPQVGERLEEAMALKVDAERLAPAQSEQLRIAAAVLLKLDKVNQPLSPASRSWLTALLE